MRALFSGCTPFTKSSRTWLSERVSTGPVLPLPLALPFPLELALAFGFAVGSDGMGSAGAEALVISGAAPERKY